MGVCVVCVCTTCSKIACVVFSLDPSNTFSGDAMDERGNPIVQGLLAKVVRKVSRRAGFRQIHGEVVDRRLAPRTRIGRRTVGHSFTLVY